MAAFQVFRPSMPALPQQFIGRGSRGTQTIPNERPGIFVVPPVTLMHGFLRTPVGLL
ncbi:hypothetical protein PSAB6_460026 [Paraburkholderia sabiae]|nr:hypothetical protein PSAB6_460026 [Paraburkholderia sabiae]